MVKTKGNKFSANKETRMQAAKEYLESKVTNTPLTLRSVGKKYGVSDTTIHNWINEYQTKDIAVNKQQKRNSNGRTDEERIIIAMEYLTSENSLNDVAKNNNISVNTLAGILAWYKGYIGETHYQNLIAKQKQIERDK